MPNSVSRRKKNARSTEPRRPRIISGSARGRRILTPQGVPGFRPILDRIKTAVFNVLGPGFQYPRVLDLFAGSGSLGFEAASRGAEEVVLVERDRRCLEHLRRNLADLGFDGLCRVVASDAALFLKSGEAAFDLVFMDPPFEWARSDRFAEIADLSWRSTADGGVLVIRTPADCDELFLPPEARPDSRRYGRSRVAFVRKGKAPHAR